MLLTTRTPPVVTCDGRGVVSHAGTVLLSELADRIGLTALLGEATDGLRERRGGHDPGRVLVDVAVAIADGAVTITDVQALADQEGLHGPAGSVASTSTIWRVLAGIDESMLARIRQARAESRDRAWTARGELTGTELPGSRAGGLAGWRQDDQRGRDRHGRHAGHGALGQGRLNRPGLLGGS